MTGSGTTIPYTKLHFSAHMVSKASGHYQHCQPWLRREATPPAVSSLGDKGRLCTPGCEKATREIDQHWKVMPKEGRNKTWWSEVIQKQRQGNRGEEKTQPKAKDWNKKGGYLDLKWRICSCFVWSLPSFTLLPLYMSRALRFMVRSWEDAQNRDCWFWCSTWNRVFVVCNPQLQNKQNQRRDLSIERADTTASLSLLQNRFIHLQCLAFHFHLKWNGISSNRTLLEQINPRRQLKEEVKSLKNKNKAVT